MLSPGNHYHLCPNFSVTWPCPPSWAHQRPGRPLLTGHQHPAFPFPCVVDTTGSVCTWDAFPYFPPHPGISQMSISLATHIAYIFVPIDFSLNVFPQPHNSSGTHPGSHFLFQFSAHFLHKTCNYPKILFSFYLFCSFFLSSWQGICKLSLMTETCLYCWFLYFVECPVLIIC